MVASCRLSRVFEVIIYFFFRYGARQLPVTPCFLSLSALCECGVTSLTFDFLTRPTSCLEFRWMHSFPSSHRSLAHERIHSTSSHSQIFTVCLLFPTFCLPSILRPFPRTSLTFMKICRALLHFQHCLRRKEAQTNIFCNHGIAAPAVNVTIYFLW